MAQSGAGVVQQGLLNIPRRYQAIVGAVDFLGNNLTRCWRWVRRDTSSNEIPLQKVKTIVVMRFGEIGDVLLTTPILRALREYYPAAQIDIVVGSWSAEILADNPHISRVLVYDVPWCNSKTKKKFSLLQAVKFLARSGIVRMLRRQRYDLALDFNGDLRTNLLMFLLGARYRVSYGHGGGGFLLTKALRFSDEYLHVIEHHLRFLEEVRIPHQSKDLVLPISEEDEKAVDEFLRRQADRWDAPLVAICPGAGYPPSKRWTSDGFAAVADAAVRKWNVQVVICGAKDEVGLAQQVSRMMRAPSLIAAGQLSLKQFAALLRRCNLVVCNDSAPMHIGVAVGAPVVAIRGFYVFGDAELWGYKKSNYIRLSARMPCHPCTTHRRLTCPDLRCMRAITPIAVMEAAGRVFRRDQSTGPVALAQVPHLVVDDRTCRELSHCRTEELT